MVVQTGRSNKTLLALPDVLLLNSKLPKRAQRWTLAYMLDSRSQNWETLKQAIYGKGQTIIVIQDANGDIFGMYGSRKWFPSEGFFGNDECFLFTLKPDVNIYEGSGRDNNFQLFTESGIGMGGTAERLGLFIQSGMVKGSTSLACGTFREFWPLARELEFKITQIEIWAVDDKETQAVVEQDIVKLISQTQYMRIKGDEVVYNETRKLDQPEGKQPRVVYNVVIDNKPVMPARAMRGPLRCSGKCAMRSQPKRGPRYNQGGVCCSKRCTKKIEVRSSPINPRGEGDGNAKVHTAQRYPQQEEEKHQRHPRYAERKVTIKREKRCPRISFDARQKHGAAGFIHPSLAAEENERNAREAREAKAASPPSIISKSNRPTTSKKRRLSTGHDLSQKSGSPTFTHNKTQVGESRLMKPTCRSYKHENKCACIVKKTCACTPKDTSLASSGRGEKTYMIKTNYTTSEVAYAEGLRSNECKSTKTAKTNPNMTSETDCDSVRTYLSRSGAPNDFTAESSSTVLIALNNSDPDLKNEPVESSVSETTTQCEKSQVKKTTEKEKSAKKSAQPTSEASVRTKQTLPLTKSDSNSKPTRKVHDSKDKNEDKSRSDNKQNTLASSKKNLDKTLKVSSQDELDCHCSSSTDRNDVEVEIKKCDPASTCCCETKVSSYLTKLNQTDITGVPLSEISSSVCSCIFDNKNKITATSAGISEISYKKETQSLTKSRRKSHGSACSEPAPYILTKNANKPKKMSRRSPTSSIASKKETQFHVKSRRLSTTSTFSSFQSNEPPQPVPPTCLRCKTLVEQHGCQCKAQSISNNIKPTPVQTSRLLQKELSKNQLASKNGGSRRSVVIDTEAMSFISGGSKNELEERSISVSLVSSRNINRASSQSSQIKQAEKKSCKTSCKCSLARSYFPIFPEDLIKEGGTSEDCDCASYNNLRFPVIVETPPEATPEPSVKSRATVEADQVNGLEEEEDEHEIQDKKCGCDDNDNTIIILNVSKCNTAETVEKIIEELEVKTGDASNQNIKSLVLKCRDLSESKPSALQYTPCTSKGEPEREALRQHIERILKRKSNAVQPEQEEQPEG